jgi:CubicO group peptidase (beta-lactamase class C family)
MFQFEEKINRLLKGGKQIHAFAIIDKKAELYSKTYADYCEDDLHNVYSVTKSITSLIAIKASLESGVSMDTPILRHLDYKANNPLVYQMTVEDFINMKSGFDWDELRSFNDPTNPFQRFLNGEKPLEFLFNHRVINLPNEVYAYNSALTHALVYWTENVMKRPFEALVWEWLFEPLGICKFKWDKDKQGKVFGGHGLSLSFIDLKKIASLFLGEGAYLKERIFSTEMMNYFKRMTSHNIRGYKGYGYGMWHGEVKGCLFSAAFGHAGQRIYWFYELEMIFVFLGNIRPEFGYQEKIIASYLKEFK